MTRAVAVKCDRCSRVWSVEGSNHPPGNVERVRISIEGQAGEIVLASADLCGDCMCALGWRDKQGVRPPASVLELPSAGEAITAPWWQWRKRR